MASLSNSDGPSTDEAVVTAGTTPRTAPSSVVAVDTHASGTVPDTVAATPAMATASRPARRRRHPWPRQARMVIRLGGLVVIGAWLVALVVFSTVLYQRNNLTADFATYNQAWTLIGQGHADPYSTIYAGSSFLSRDFELAVWPLALLYRLDPHPVVLLWVQDLAIAASAYVAYTWIADYLTRQRVNWKWSIGICLLVLTALVLNPGVYQTLLYDFHLEPISTVFVLLAARDLWSGRSRRAWVWVAITLLFGSFAAITLIGLGLSALLASRDTRRHGLAVMATGVGWLALISLVGADAGAGLGYYAYLADRNTLSGPSGVLLIAGGILRHPTRVTNMLHERLHYMWMLIRPVGIVGLASAWGFGVPVVVMVTNALNSQYGFIFQAFQNSAVFPFVLVGTVMVLTWAVRRFRFGWVPVAAVAAAVTAAALSYGLSTSWGNVQWAATRVAPPQATQLNRALRIIPPQAEVVSTIGIMGRFSGRAWSYWFNQGSTYPVHGRTVFFVFDPANENTVPNLFPSDDEAGARYAEAGLGARVRIDEGGVTVLEWHPPAGATHFQFPPRARTANAARPG